MSSSTSRSRTGRALVAVAALALPVVLTGCTGDGADSVEVAASSTPGSATPDAVEDTDSPTGAQSSGSDSDTDGGGQGDASGGSDGSDAGSGGDTQAGGLPFPANTDRDTGQASGEPGTVTAVRLASQDGYDRVVFELAGGGTPGWDVRYDDDPRTHGEGAPVDLPGDAVLHVTITGTGYPFDTGQEEYSGGDLSGSGVVNAVRFGGVYEGQTQAFIGVDSRTPFRVFLEESPARVVVDVVDPS